MNLIWILRSTQNDNIGSCHCEEPESNEEDAAISPIDSGKISFYGEPIGKKMDFEYLL